jgi:hypothetical protein
MMRSGDDLGSTNSSWLDTKISAYFFLIPIIN